MPAQLSCISGPTLLMETKIRKRSRFWQILHVRECNAWESESHSVMSDSLWPHGLHSPLNSPGQNTGVGSRSLLQWIFPTQESSRGLLNCRQIPYQLSYQGSPMHEKYYFFKGQRTAHKAENQVTSMWKLHPLLINRNKYGLREFQGNIKIRQISPIAPAWANWWGHLWRPWLADETLSVGPHSPVY